MKAAGYLMAFLLSASAAAVEVVHDATPAGARMAEEIRRYVPEMSIGGVPLKAVHLGDTELARELGIAAAEMKPDSFVIRSAGDALVIAGGGSRGTVHGVYVFLEKHLGVFIWSPLEESAPAVGKIALPALDERQEFFFVLRDMYKTNLPSDGGRAAVARGFSRNGDAGITAEFGGGWEYGPPYPCHTFDRYLPATQYLPEHPEWFSLVDGKRIGGQVVGQLCLTNPELRQFFTRLLLDTIAQAERDAAAKGVPPPRIYDISHNDNTSFCTCESCAAFTEREKQSGLMIDFVNELARAVDERYPGVLLQTFAYQYTLEPPVTVRPEPNVVIRLCNTYSDQITGASGNPELQRQLRIWSEIAPALFVWDYAIVFGEATGLPFPSEYHYPANYRCYADHGVTGMFWEQECADRSDMAELKYFLHGKYMQDPYREDFEALLDVFYSRYYGAAGTFVRQYRDLLYRRALAGKPWIGWFPAAGDFGYIDLATMTEAQKLLASAREAAEDDTFRFRVDRAAMGVDRLLGFELTRNYFKEAGEGILPQIEAARERFLATWKRTAEAGWVIPDQEKMLERFERLRRLPLTVVPSEKFQGISHADRPAAVLSAVLDHTRLVPDAEAETGAAVAAEIDPADPGVYTRPVSLGVYNPVRQLGVAAMDIPRDQTARPGYHWYCLRHVQLPEDSCFLWLSPSWGIQLSLSDVAPLRREEPLDIWVRMKTAGPLFQPGSGEPGRISFDRVVLTPAGALP